MKCIYKIEVLNEGSFNEHLKFFKDDNELRNWDFQSLTVHKMDGFL